MALRRGQYGRRSPSFRQGEYKVGSARSGVAGRAKRAAVSAWRDATTGRAAARTTRALCMRETRLLEPLARDLRRWRLRCPPSEDGLVFPSSRGDQWTGDDWDNWRERIFQPAAEAVGLPKDTRPRDLRGSFASLLIYEGVDVVELAPELGHSPATCLRYYARLFEEFKGLPKCPAVDVIREARKAVAAGTVPPRYLRDDAGGVGAVWAVGASAS
jgi:hypothetical protein